MATVSVITAASTSGLEHLAATAQSLQAQRLPAGWDLEWCVQLDGERAEEHIATFTWPEFARPEHHGRRLGPALARNLALLRSTGEVVVSLDADDQFTPGSLATLLDPFASPSVGWCVGRAADLYPDGRLVEFDLPFHGVVLAGLPGSWWRDHGFKLPFHTVGFAARRELVWAAGGWGGLAAGEDTVMVLAVCELADGMVLDTTTVLYRKWPKQITAGDTYRQLATPSHAFISRRLDALTRLTGRDPATAWPQPIDDVPPRPGPAGPI